MQEFIQSILSNLLDVFDPTVLGAQVVEWLVKLIVGSLVFVAFYLLWLIFRGITRPLLNRYQKDETTQRFVLTILKYAVLIIGTINTFSAIGINTTSVLTSIGIAGITIGFAARDAFSNLIAGLLIYLDRPFVIGDLIEIGDNYGRVSEITLRSTRIVTTDGKMLAVPNSEVINTTVASYTNFPHLRLDIAVTIAVTENLNRVRELLLALVTTDPAYLPDPPPSVVVTELNDYNVALELRAWINNEREHIEKRSELREAVFKRLP